MVISTQFKTMAKKYQPTLAIDFDGVIHRYSQGWADGTIYDEPMPGARDALAVLIDKGWRVVVLTSRASDADKRAEVMEWLDMHDIPYHDVTNVKVAAMLYIDDRALRFTDWQDAMTEVDRLQMLE